MMEKNDYIRGLLFFCLAAVLAAACSIPFYFESPSLYYKTGVDKFLLRSGKIVGIIAGVLLLWQLVLAGRFKLLENAFGPKQMITLHRKNGLLILGAAVLHPIGILGADHFVFFSFEKKYWPEFVGVAFLILLAGFVLLSHFQKKAGLNYMTWRRLHKIGAPIIFILFFIHVYNVSRTFESGIPFYGLCAVIAAAVFLFLRRFLSR